MGTGAITGYIDVAQVTLYVFWAFFAGLLLYLRREDRREGYPLVDERTGAVRIDGSGGIPKPKRFLLEDGRVQIAPRAETQMPIAARPTAPWAGAPLTPTGNPMVDGVGPAAYAQRPDEPERTHEEGLPLIVPMRVATTSTLDPEDPDPRGMGVIAADGLPAGTVVDAWVDRSETLVRYLEVETQSAGGPRRVLVPMTLIRIDEKRGVIRVAAVLARHFADAPTTRHPDEVTLLEEDRIMAYFGSGHMYATPDRMGPIL